MFLTIGSVEHVLDNDTLAWTILSSHKMIDLCGCWPADLLGVIRDRRG